MGFFKYHKLQKEREKKRQEYIRMTPADLAKVTDYNLPTAISDRIAAKSDGLLEEDCLELFKGAKRVYYILNLFDNKFYDGGLYEFFSCNSRCAAPYVSECFAIINDEYHKKLFDDFVAEYNIDLVRLASQDEDEIAAEMEDIPFDEFDNGYYSKQHYTVNSMLTIYAREHLDEL